jgi:hypothetical protein
MEEVSITVNMIDTPYDSWTAYICEKWKDYLRRQEQALQYWT